MKLYGVTDGPPTLAVRLALKALEVPHELIMVDFCKGEHRTEDYAKMNPSKEIPVLEDDGFYLSESIAIIQYLFDKYAPEGSKYYPKDPKQRAICNHRMVFNSCLYYNYISAYTVAPIFFDYPKNEWALKRVEVALDTYEAYLKQQNTKYAAGDHVTVGDFTLIAGTIYLEATEFDISRWPLVKAWYENFKKEQEFWKIAQEVLDWCIHFAKNAPDMTGYEHPFHPKRN